MPDDADGKKERGRALRGEGIYDPGVSAIFHRRFSPCCTSLVMVESLAGNLTTLLWFFTVSFSERFVWGGRRPAGHDQKHIEDEERNGNVVEESRLA